MRKKLLAGVATGLLLLVAGGTADATPITFDFRGTVENFQTSFDFGVAPELTVHVTGSALPEQPRGVIQSSLGLGVWQPGVDPNKQVENGGVVDQLVLDFSGEVILMLATFTSYINGDTFTVSGDGSWSSPLASVVNFSYVYGDTFIFSPGDGVTSTSGAPADLFRLASITVEKVPEPSTLLLLGIGCLGLAGLRRRRS
jgi:hypothetical protein